MISTVRSGNGNVGDGSNYHNYNSGSHNQFTNNWVSFASAPFPSPTRAHTPPTSPSTTVQSRQQQQYQQYQQQQLQQQQHQQQPFFTSTSTISLSQQLQQYHEQQQDQQHMPAPPSSPSRMRSKSNSTSSPLPFLKESSATTAVFHDDMVQHRWSNVANPVSPNRIASNSSLNLGSPIEQSRGVIAIHMPSSPLTHQQHVCLRCRVETSRCTCPFTSVLASPKPFDLSDIPWLAQE
eukprot:c13173_g2_i3.p1 GENE.c13173_g2_i3~~c13173_g2_i3.p1  ORF type:complete len:270 (-),score=51.02 c13173_g2_i3:424-1131(-)